ncbi:probable ATP-dependent RNA helicase DDX31 [Athalia rosae]|uniref:probable ATP-dependent RNA helicase DDX31 n=1 Tax=Athalia rosae TaxID=37344 RepID=UPI002033D94B|nr:probable ATP-dependent RNA helicase DDX31 [Athalia rosae]
MTVQDMDISLNISTTAPAKGTSKKTTGYKKEFFKPQFKRQMKKLNRSKVRNDSIEKDNTELITDAPKSRIKQKSLAAIVNRNLMTQKLAKNITKADQISKNVKATTSNSSSEKSDFKHQFHASDSDKTQEPSVSDKPIVSFADPGKGTSIKTILARKRDKNHNADKKSLGDIFQKKSDAIDSEVTLALPTEPAQILDKPETRPANIKRKSNEHTGDSRGTKKVKFDNNKNFNVGNRDSTKNISDNVHANQPLRGGGGSKISSLFGNNPEIPNIGQRFVKPVDEAVFSVTKFSDFDLHPFMVQNLEQNMQITKLTTVQQKAIPEILSGKDVLVRSQTGSGKTLAYALPIVESLHKIRPKLTRESGLRALIVVPTRELALQTYECFLKLIKSFTWIVPGYLVGGEKRKAEKARLRKGCTILVATPGRLLDHIKHTESLRLHDVQCFVLDEADRMLDMGYEKDISGIVSALEEQKGMPRFGVKKVVKTQSEDNSNSGYNPLQMLRQNAKKIFTDSEVDAMRTETIKTDETSSINETSGPEKSLVTKERENTENVDIEKVKPSNVIHSEIRAEDDDDEDDDDDDDDEGGTQREYHSGTESDSDGAGQDFPIRMKKNNRIKPFLPVPRDKKKMIASQHRIKEDTDVNLCQDDAKPDLIANPEPPRDQNRRQTILLSATLTQAVEKLAGLTMDNPVVVDAARENLERAGGSVSEINEDLIVPQSVAQSYVVTPPKLRLVSLSAYIAGKCQAAGQHKTLVFMATQDMVDYHAEILTSVLCRPSDDNDEDSEPLVDVEFFKLHGNMTQKERTEVFKTFRAAKSGVLLCTDVAARGLDLPKVDSVVQYTGPLSARDYVHRVGRTARAGSSGSAVIFLTPPEVEFVRMLESRRVRIQQEDMSGILDKLLGPLSTRNSVEAAATALQNQFETLVLEDKEIHKKACKAYVSWIRFYASYPREMREIFDRKELHLGHFAKSFGLRDPPQKIGGIGKTLQDNGKKIHNNRLSNERPKKVFPQKQGARGVAAKAGVLKKVRMLNTSEYGSGLEKVKKTKKF